jgi:hypothetical protein
VTWLLDLYHQIPSGLLGPIGAFVASCLTAVVAFSGVALSNRAALRRQRIDLQSAAEMAKTERDQALRKTIYLDTLNDIGNQLGVLSDLWHIHSPNAISIDLWKAYGSMYRTYLVASPKTFDALIALNEAVLRASTEAIPLRSSFMLVTASRQHMENLLERIRGEHERLESELKTDRPDEVRRTEIEARKLHLVEMEKTALDGLIEQNAFMTSSSMSILMIGARTRNAVEEKVFPLIAAIREELALPAISEETFRLLTATAGRGLDVAEKAVSDLKAMIPSVLESSGITTTVKQAKPSDGSAQ